VSFIVTPCYGWDDCSSTISVDIDYQHPCTKRTLLIYNDQCDGVGEVVGYCPLTVRGVVTVDKRASNLFGELVFREDVNG